METGLKVGVVRSMLTLCQLRLRLCLPRRLLRLELISVEINSFLRDQANPRRREEKETVTNPTAIITPRGQIRDLLAEIKSALGHTIINNR